MSAGSARPSVECDVCGLNMDYVDEGKGGAAFWRCSDTVNCGHEDHEEEEADTTCPDCGLDKEMVWVDGIKQLQCPPCWDKKLDAERRARFGDPQAALQNALTKDGGIF